MDAVERDAVRLGFDAQKSAQEFVKLIGAEPHKILAPHLEGRGGAGAWPRIGVPSKHPDRIGICFQHAEQADRGCPRPHVNTPQPTPSLFDWKPAETR